MSLDTALLKDVKKEVTVSELPLNRPLHTITLDHEGLSELASRLSKEGSWCMFDTSELNLTGYTTMKDTHAQFQVGRRGLFVEKNRDGVKQLRIDVKKTPNWSFNGKHEGFVLYKGNRFEVADSVEVPFDFTKSSSYIRDAPFSPRGPTRETSMNIKSVKGFDVGDFFPKNGYDVQKDYATTRVGCVPFNVKFPNLINKGAMTLALMTYHNSLVDEGRLDEEKIVGIAREHHGITLESLARNGFDFNKARIYETPNYPERNQIRTARNRVYSRAQRALDEVIRAYAIKKVWGTISQDRTVDCHGSGNGFNGVTDYYSGQMHDGNKFMPVNIQLMTNPNDPSEVWAKALDLGGRKKLMGVYTNLKEGDNPDFIVK